ncbi:hypothetical protein N824_19600 [Pedobacter sp. V48]|nr:hypothetical protein N824_19600 [Pedobacter sp. V48]
MQLAIEELKKTRGVSPGQIIYFNFEDERLTRCTYSNNASLEMDVKLLTLYQSPNWTFVLLKIKI